jgi:hypothetical protein
MHLSTWEDADVMLMLAVFKATTAADRAFYEVGITVALSLQRLQWEVSQLPSLARYPTTVPIASVPCLSSYADDSSSELYSNLTTDTTLLRYSQGLPHTPA